MEDMRFMNRVILTGRLTKEPELKEFNNLKVLGFVIAVNRLAKEQQADFIQIKAFNHNAEFISKFCQKGTLILVDGRLKSDSYQGQDGKMNYVTFVELDRVEILTPKSQEQKQEPKQQAPQTPPPNNFPVDNDLPF